MPPKIRCHDRDHLAAGAVPSHRTPEQIMNDAEAARRRSDTVAELRYLSEAQESFNAWAAEMRAVIRRSIRAAKRQLTTSQ